MPVVTDGSRVGRAIDALVVAATGHWRGLATHWVFPTGTDK